MLVPILLVGGGIVTLVALALVSSEDRPVPDHQPDLPLPLAPGSTGHKYVDAMMGELRKASASSGAPLGLLAGWVAKESGGLLEDYGSPRSKVTKYNERGYFQLMPDDSKSLQLDHLRLSSDPNYSINGGLALIGRKMGEVDKLGVAQRGTSYYWLLVKLAHTMGTGAMNKIVAAAKAAGAAGSWKDLENYALDNNADLLHLTKHSPAKWFPLIDEIYRIGAPFGFGNGAAIVGGTYFNDIPDPLDVLKKA